MLESFADPLLPPAGDQCDATMQISINGQPQTVASAQTVSELLTELQLAGKRIAVERNGEVVPKSLHTTTTLADGDRFEIIVAVGGG